MKPITVVGIVLVALGIVALAYQGITYTTREKAFDVGALHVTTEQTRRIPLPPVLGAIALVGGIALLVVDRKGLGRAVAR
jgi:hypothetical protein